MTRYIVPITDFHERIAAAIQQPGDVVVRFPKRGSRRQKMRSLPHIAGGLLRALIDPGAHVIVSHPFSSVTSAFLAVAKHASFFDDGTAYYGAPVLPTGKREHIDRFLARRFVHWRSLSSDATYPMMLAHARLSGFYAICPELLESLPYPVFPVDTTRAFPKTLSDTEATQALFLDTRDEFVSAFSIPAILYLLHEYAMKSPNQTLLFKAHPSQTSRISEALRRESWAQEIAGSLEQSSLVATLRHLISFYSSGAISVKIANPLCQLICIAGTHDRVAPGIRRLFEKLDAEEVQVDTVRK